MNRISLFKTRIVIEDKVYLLAKDVRKALGYKSIDQLQSEHSEIIKHIKDLPALVLESDFNTILTSDMDAIKKLKHIEIAFLTRTASSEISLRPLLRIQPGFHLE